MSTLFLLIGATGYGMVVLGALILLLGCLFPE
jgi:hypothetical protein